MVDREELRRKLQLPSVLLDCQDRAELRSLALLGQGFQPWAASPAQSHVRRIAEFWSTDVGAGAMSESQASLQLSFTGPAGEDEEEGSPPCTCASVCPPSPVPL